ncbi:MAG: hypothetical protein HQM09_08645 [Candidatus Riflebacteria bacterium]|nr:hypothetical protein [Candidatus Riflebacteria bacterium]
MNRLKTMARGNKERSGMAMVIVSVIFIMVAILFMTLSMSSNRLRHVTAGVLEENQARVFANSAAEVFWPFFEDCLRKRAGCPKLFPKSGCDSPLNPYSGQDLDGFTLSTGDFDNKDALKASLDQLAEFCSENTPPIQEFGVEVRWHCQKPIQANGMNVRLNGTVETIISVFLQTNRGTTPWQFGRKDVHIFSFSREFKLFQIMPAPASRFTLFVKKCQQEQFNIQEKKFQEDDGKQKILVLHNSPRNFSSTDTEAWKKSGWIYLGEDRVVLNVDGSHPCRSQSEYFFFTPTVAYQPDSVQLFSCTSLFPGSPIRYGWMMLGCNEEWVTSVPMRWLIDYPFDLKTSGNVPKLVEHVSVLRLFGDKDHVTPTKVFGKSHFRAVFYGALVYDANEDGAADYLVPVASGSTTVILPKTLGAFPIVRLPSVSDYPPNHQYPTLLNVDLYELFDLGNMGVSGIPSNLGGLVPGYEGQTICYRNLMSMVSFEDFFLENSSANAVYDGIFAGAGTGIDPVTKDRKKNFDKTDYPNDGSGFLLNAKWQSNLELFRGDLSKTDLVGPYKNPAFFATVFSGQNEFLCEGPITRDGNNARIDKATVARIEGDLQLPDNLIIDAPCLIVANGNISVGKLESGKPGSSPHGRLVLISLSGNITMAGGNVGKVVLMAPSGTVTWTDRLYMSGCLCANQLNPNVISQSGGQIDYDTDCDVSDPQSFLRGITVILGPSLPGFQNREPNS